ncbi:MAG: hypothetical protein ACXWEJ_03200 [Actinomycetota bacterium]
MSLDARIRTALDRDASKVEPATDPALQKIMERGPRRRAARTVGRAVAIAAVVSVFVVGTLAALLATKGGVHRAGTGPVVSASPIDGQWQIMLSIEDGLDGGVPYGRARLLAGPRQLELSLGVVRQIRPGSFETVPVNGTFEVEGPFLVIRDHGETLVFRWALSGNELRLSLVDDSRPNGGDRIDRLIWTKHPWERIG